MAQRIVLPNGDNLDFPDGMADKDIETAIQSEYPEYAPKQSLLSKFGSAAKSAAQGISSALSGKPEAGMPSTMDAEGYGPTPESEPSPETVNLPGSVMHGSPVEKNNQYPAGAPVRPEARRGITRTLESATPDQRAEIAAHPDWVGQVAAPQVESWQKQDAMAAGLPAIEGMTGRVEDHRRNLITAGGMTSEAAANKAQSDVAMNAATDMPGAVRESRLDFDAQHGAERYWNDFSGGVVGSTGASLSYLSKKTNVQTLSDIGDSMDTWAQGKQPAEGNFTDKLINAVGSMASFYVPGIGVMKGASALHVVSPVMAKWAGAGTMAGIEAAAEADGVFKELKRKGYADEQAMAQADKGFLANMAVLGITNKIGLFNDLKMFDDAGKFVVDNAIKKAAVGAASEGPGQELPQQMIQNYLTGRPLMEGAGESALIGAIAGGGSAVIGGAVTESVKDRSAGAQIGEAIDQSVGATNFAQRGIDAGVIASMSPNPQQVPAGNIVPERGILTRAANLAARSGVLPQVAPVVSPTADDALLSDVQGLAFQGEQNGATTEPGTGGLDAGSVPAGSDIAGGTGGNVVPVDGHGVPVADGTGRPGLAGPDAGSAGEGGPAGNGVRDDAVTPAEPLPGGQYLPKAPAPKAAAPVAEAPAGPKVLSIGTMPNNAEEITVKNGAIFIGRYPAQHFETGEDITVKPGASNAQIRDALKAAGAIGRGVKVFGVEKEAPKSKVKAKRVVDNTRYSLITAIGKLGGFHTDSVEANDIRTLLGVTSNMKIPVGSGLPVFLFNKNGKKPDDMAGALHEHGYLDEHDMNAMLDKLYNDKDQGSKYAETPRGEDPEQEHEGARHGYDDLPEADQVAVSEVVAEAEDMLDDIPFLDIRTANKITSKQFKTIEEEEEAIFGGYNEKTHEGTATGTEGGHGEADTGSAESRGEDHPGQAPGESAGVDSAPQGFSLESQTEASRREHEQEIADAIAGREADQRKADAEAKRISDQKEIDARMEVSVDNFQLGQSAEESLAGQGDIFSKPASQQASKPAPFKVDMAGRIKESRPDLADEVDEVMAESTPPANVSTNSENGDTSITMEQALKEAAEYPTADNYAFVANRKYGIPHDKAVEIFNAAKNEIPAKFVRQGDFWNYSGNRVAEIAKALELPVTSRNGVKIVGIPEHSRAQMEGELNKAGIQVEFGSGDTSKQSAIAAIKSSDMSAGEKLNTIAAVNKGDIAPEDVQDVVGKEAGKGGRIESVEKGHRAAAQQMLDAIGNDELSDYGLRVIPGEFDGDISIGDILPNSRAWNDGHETEEELQGTSSAGIKRHTIDGILEALRNLGAHGKPGENGFYFGNRVVLVRGNRVGSGEDVGESIIENAEVVGIWKKPTKGNSEVEPNNVSKGVARPGNEQPAQEDGVEYADQELDLWRNRAAEENRLVKDSIRSAVFMAGAYDAIFGKQKRESSTSAANYIAGYEWGSKNKPAQESKSEEANGRDKFTLDRLNHDTNQMELVTFERGEYVRYAIGGKDSFGEIDGISHSKREFSVDGLWYPFGFAYKAEKPAEYQKPTVPLSSVVESANQKHGSDLDYKDRIHTLAVHDDVMDRAISGDITADEFKASFDALLKNQAGITAELESLTKPQIFKQFPGLEYRYKNDKKADVIRAAYRDMISSYTMGESYSYGMSSGSMENSIRAMVDKTTDESLAEFADGVKKRREERAAQRAEALTGMDDPQTLGDFNNLMNAKAQEIGEGATFGQARMALTPEQRAKFDELASEKSRAERASRKASQQEQTLRAPGEAVTASEIIKTKHTKHGHDLWQFNLDQRVSGEEFKSLVAQAKRLGGDYSSYRGNWAIPGWQFRTEEAAKAFKALLAGDTADAKDVMQARRDAYADDRSQTATERLNEMADSLEEKADASLNQERKANTHKRARQAASAEAAASSDKAMAQTMRNIASGIQAGTAKMLDKVRQKIQVEMLRSFMHTAQSDMLNKLYPSYAERERHNGEKPTAEVADYATFPAYTAYRSDLASLGRALLETEGTMKLGQRLMKVADDVSAAYLKFAKENLHKVSTFSKTGGGGAVFASKGEAEAVIARSGFRGQAIVLPFKRGQNIIIMSPSESIKRGVWTGDNDKRITLSDDFGAELVEKIGKVARRGAKVSVPWQFESAYDKRKRLASMNIETPAELRAALREFIALREAPKEADKIKQMERAMVGRQNDGLDFFPTSASVADEMIDAAEIEEGMSVLEPSAGMGHIAERIRAAGVDPDVVELANERKELLEAKGFRVVGRDFMDIKPREFFMFGDTFKAEDGTEGIMRGSGGLGSNRVRLVDAEGNKSFHDRDELTGIKKNGLESGYDRILMNPPFSDGRAAQHVQHAYDMLKPGGRLVAIVDEGVFFRGDKKAQEFRDWMERVGATDEKLAEGSFMDPSLPVNTGVNARMVVISKEVDTGTALYSREKRSHDLDVPGFSNFEAIPSNDGSVKFYGTAKIKGETYYSTITVTFREDGTPKIGLTDYRFETTTGKPVRGSANVALEALMDEAKSAAITWARDGGTALFSKPEEQITRQQGLQKVDVEALTKKLTAHWNNAPKISVVQSIDDLPANLRDQVYSAGADGDMEGIYLPKSKQVYLIADHLPTPQRAMFVLLHESIGHHGLRGIFGDGIKPVMMQIYLTNASVRTRADKLVKQYGYDKALATEEVLADMPGEGAIEKLNGWKRIVSYIMGKLRLWGMTDKWTDSDVISLLAKAGRHVIEGEGLQVAGGMQAVLASRADKENHVDGAEASAFNNPELLSGFDVTDTIEISAPKWTEQEIKDLETGFLSSLPAGMRYTNSTKLLGRIRTASEAAANDIGGKATAERVVAGMVGPFTGYRTDAEIVEPDGFNPDGYLRISVWGKEQAAAGLTDEPALTFIVRADGELLVNGPNPFSKTFSEFKQRGWAEEATGNDGHPIDGWSRLIDPASSNHKLPNSQVIALLADVHARTKAWRMEPKVGLYWSRSTGSMGGLDGSLADKGSAVFFSRQASLNIPPSIVFGRDIAPLAIRAYKSLSADAARIIDSWNINWHRGQDRMLNSKEAEEIRAAYAPVRDKIRSIYGDTVPAYRGESNGGNATGEDRTMFSWTPIKDIAVSFGINSSRGMPPEITQSMVDKAVEDYEKNGVVKFNGAKYVKSSAEGMGDDYFLMYNRYEIITDGEGIRRTLQAERDEREAYREELRGKGKVYYSDIPVESIFFIPIGANLKHPEFVAEYNPRSMPSADVLFSRKTPISQQSPLPGINNQRPPSIPQQPSLGLTGGAPGNNATWDAPEPSKFDNVVYELQNKHVDTKRVIEAINQNGQIKDSFDPYLQEELYHKRTAKRVSDFQTQELKPLLVEMTQRGVDIAQMEEYLHARHAKEANQHIADINPASPDMQDGGSGMTTQEADDYLNGLAPERKKTLSLLAGKVDAMIAKTRQTLVDYRIESGDTIQSWADAYQHYVPLFREDVGSGPGTGQGFSVRGSSSKARTGSKRKVVDIIGNIAMQRERAVVRGEKNRVALALYGLAKTNPNPDFWTADKAPSQRVLDEDTNTVVTQADPLFKSRENVVVSRMVNPQTGKVEEHAVVFNERDERAMRMAAAMKNLDMDDLGHVLGLAAKGTRYFASINTQYNPIFGLMNVTRDIQGALVNLSSTPIAGHQKEVMAHTLSAMRGIYLDIRDHRKGVTPSSQWAALWEEMQNEGGTTGYSELFRTSEDRAKALQSEINQISEGKLKHAGRAIFDWLSDYNETMENSVRLAAYKTAIDNGMSRPRAASLAKTLTVNFNRKGRMGSQAGALYAFFNASMQGTARMAEALKGPAGKKIILGGLTIGVMQAMALAMAGFDDDEPPEFVRERNIIIPLTPVSGKKNYLTIPMPLGLHVIPNIGRLATELALGGFRHPGDKVVQLLGVLMSAFNPIGSATALQTITPTLIDPIAALAENKDWTGKPIYREERNGMNPTPGFTRAKNTSSFYARWTAEAINTLTGGTDYQPGKASPTPDQIDYLIGQVTGGVGREASKVVQTGESMFSGEELPAYKRPLLGRLYGNAEEGASQAGRFYENLKRINGHEAEIKGRAVHHEEYRSYITDNPDAKLIGPANEAENIVRHLNKQKRMLIEKEAPRVQIKQIEAQITAKMAKFNEKVRALSAAATP